MGLLGAEGTLLAIGFAVTAKVAPIDFCHKATQDTKVELGLSVNTGYSGHRITGEESGGVVEYVLHLRSTLLSTCVCLRQRL